MGSFYHYPLDGQHFYMSSTKLKIGSRRPNAARERSRIKNLRDAFQLLQSALPAVPPSTKLSKLDVLLMASAYIAHLGRLVEDKEFITSEHHLTLHPVKKWPMRARLYAGLNYSGSSRSFDPQNSHHRFAADNNEYS